MTGGTSLRIRYKELRKKLVSFTPFVRRGRHEKAVARLSDRLQQELDRRLREQAGLGYLFLERPPSANAARIDMRVPLASTITDELCLFVTHAASADIKPHVIDHMEALIAANIRVVLIVNTDLEPAALRFPVGLMDALQGCIVRENVGFDFGAWAHAYSLINPHTVRTRLYLMNDSIVGPLDVAAYGTLLSRVRESTADCVGLTRNADPQDHLQSYFLAINQRLLRAAAFDEFMRNVVNMPSKQNVIDCYETWLTAFLQRRGFTTQSIFPRLSDALHPYADDTIWRWRRLVELGFPFVKSAVLAHPAMANEARKLVPPRYLTTGPAPVNAQVRGAA